MVHIFIVLRGIGERKQLSKQYLLQLLQFWREMCPDLSENHTIPGSVKGQLWREWYRYPDLSGSQALPTTVKGERYPDLSWSQAVHETGMWWGKVFMQDVAILFLFGELLQLSSALPCPTLRGLPSRGICFFFCSAPIRELYNRGIYLFSALAQDVTSPASLC